jgi:hypothetical protein
MYKEMGKQRITGKAYHMTNNLTETSTDECLHMSYIMLLKVSALCSSNAKPTLLTLLSISWINGKMYWPFSFPSSSV